MSSRIGILGGTFNPIHLGHLIIASFAAEELQLDRVLFTPAQSPPHKVGEAVLAAEHRVAMVKAAIESDPRFRFSDLDLRLNRPSYTAELLERFRKEEPNAELFFIVGADSLWNFPRWHRPHDILEMARLAIAHRPGMPIEDVHLDALPRLRQRTTLFHAPLIEISSTDIRQRRRDGKPITWLVPQSVESYIDLHGLYRS